MIQKMIATAIAVAIVGIMPMVHKSVNVYLMGFFRDVARVKARKRRMNEHAVVSMKDMKNIIFENEEDDPLKDIVDQIMMSDDIHVYNASSEDEDMTSRLEDLPVYTREELHEFGNGENGAILLSLFGRVYDVSEGQKYYGADGKYHLFAGRDVTKALATGCLREACLGSMHSEQITNAGTAANDNDTVKLDEKTLKEGKKWLAFFETHDSYAHVGFLKDANVQSIEHLIDSLLEKATAEAETVASEANIGQTETAASELGHTAIDTDENKDDSKSNPTEIEL